MRLSSKRKRPEVGTYTPRTHWTGELVLWRTVPAQEGEDLRWECVDGRWVSIAVGHGASEGAILVLDSSGRCEEVDSHDEALRVAKIWRKT
jgi:hypothetical protein